MSRNKNVRKMKSQREETAAASGSPVALEQQDAQPAEQGTSPVRFLVLVFGLPLALVLLAAFLMEHL